MIVDAAVHVWSGDTARYPWAPLGGVETPQDEAPAARLVADLDAAGIGGAIAVQPRAYGYDHAYLASVLAEHGERIAGVGLVDPAATEAAALTENLAAHRFRGVRLFANDRANDLSAAHAGDLLEAAAKMAMPVSVLAEPAHLASVGRIARAHPATTIIVDHLGLCTATTVRSEVDDLLALGALANVCVRVSAFTALSASGYPFDDLVPLIRAVHAAFGAGRLLWGTDYPYVLDAGPYRQSLDAVEAMTFLSAGDRDALLGGTAGRLYRLN